MISSSCKKKKLRRNKKEERGGEKKKKKKKGEEANMGWKSVSFSAPGPRSLFFLEAKPPILWVGEGRRKGKKKKSSPLSNLPP